VAQQRVLPQPVAGLPVANVYATALRLTNMTAW
jgi:hypothetical protein